MTIHDENSLHWKVHIQDVCNKLSIIGLNHFLKTDISFLTTISAFSHKITVLFILYVCVCVLLIPNVICILLMSNALKVITWNVTGMMSSASYLCDILTQGEIDICGISEHWLLPSNKHF